MSFIRVSFDSNAYALQNVNFSSKPDALILFSGQMDGYEF